MTPVTITVVPGSVLLSVVACLAVGIGGGLWLEPRVHDLLVRAARGSAWRGAAAAAGLQLAALLVFGVVAIAAAGLEGTARTVVTVGAALAYSPVVMSALPGKYDGYRHKRVELRRAGARSPVDRGIAWAGGPVAVLGLAALFPALFATLAP